MNYKVDLDALRESIDTDDYLNFVYGIDSMVNGFHCMIDHQNNVLLKRILTADMYNAYLKVRACIVEIGANVFVGQEMPRGAFYDKKVYEDRIMELEATVAKLEAEKS